MKTARTAIMTGFSANTVALTILGMLTVMLAGMTGSGCAPARQPPPSTTAATAPQNASFTVMPFFQGRHPEQTDQSLVRTFTCPLNNLSVNRQALADEADIIIYQMVHQAMADRFGNRVTPMHVTRSAYDRLMKDCRDKTIRSLAAELGEQLKTDYVIAGTVWRFREREGYAVSANAPASVGFSVFLLDVKAAKIQWTEAFNQTQQPLSENLLHAVSFFKQGAKWMTARELSRVGVTTVFSRFPIRGEDPERSSGE